MAAQLRKNSQRTRLIIEELDGDPYHRFNVSFAVMFLLPLLALVYVLTSELFTLEILTGRVGIILFLSIVIALSGYLFGYRIIKDILNKIIYYAARAQRSEEAKAMLIASVAHEMKNPLYTIKWCVFSISDSLDDKLNQEQNDNLATCNRTIDRMNRIVEGLLELYKLEAGMVKLKRKKIYLAQVIEKQLKEFKAVLAGKQINLVQDDFSQGLYLWGDQDKISQVVNNLLGNAIKYSETAATINIKAMVSNDIVRLEFIDQGKGIPADKLERIFDKFQRLDKSKEGTGLGLAITKDIVELHNGRIWAESELGKGSRFVVVLPRDFRQKRG